MDIVEKAARALAGWTPNVKHWEDVCEERKDAKLLQKRYRDQARTVLRAIRKPSEEMIEAGVESYGDRFYFNAEWAKMAWQAMIDEALKEDEFIAIPRLER